jgi:adenylate cyclase class 2
VAAAGNIGYPLPVTEARTESELKIPVEDLDGIRGRLRGLGAEALGAPLDEHNLLLDSAAGALKDRGQVLRLRSWGDRRVLTFKGPPRYLGAVKERLELEVEVSSLDTLGEILSQLGLTPWMRYEKRRQTWRLDDVEVALDETPLGCFVELEGPPSSLDAAARRLGLDPRSAVRASYVGLWLEHRRRHPDAPRDMVFRR